MIRAARSVGHRPQLCLTVRSDQHSAGLTAEPGLAIRPLTPLGLLPSPRRCRASPSDAGPPGCPGPGSRAHPGSGSGTVLECRRLERRPLYWPLALCGAPGHDHHAARAHQVLLPPWHAAARLAPVRHWPSKTDAVCRQEPASVAMPARMSRQRVHAAARPGAARCGTGRTHRSRTACGSRRWGGALRIQARHLALLLRTQPAACGRPWPDFAWPRWLGDLRGNVCRGQSGLLRSLVRGLDRAQWTLLGLTT